MSKDRFSDYDSTASGNEDVGGVNIQGTAPASNMDDSVRELMSHVADHFASDTIASGTTTDLGSKSAHALTVSGTTTITGFGTVKAGTIKFLTFSGALTLTHNGTSLILPGGANITTAAGDVAIVESLGSGNWRCLGYQKAATPPLDYSTGSFTATLTCGTSGTITLSGATIYYTKVGRVVHFAGLLTVGSVSSPTGSLTMGTLPFASITNGYSAVTLRIADFTASSGITWQAFLGSAATSVDIGYYAASTGTTGTGAANLMKAGTTIVIEGTYFTT